MKREHRRQLAVAGALALLFCAGGVVLIVLGFRYHAQSRAFVARAESAEGRVVGFEKWESGTGADERENILYAVVSFQTRDGRESRFLGPSQDGVERYRQGDEVRVLYEPANPEGARIDSFLGLWFGATMFWVVGGAAMVIPLLTMWEAWKWVSRQEGASDG